MTTQAEQKRDEALARVEANADQDWYDAACMAFEEVIAAYPEFTTDDVWAVLKEWQVSAPREPRAMGPIVMKLVRSGAMVATGAYRKSKRPECNARPIAVYRRAA